MAVLLDLLDKYLSAGVPSNAARDLIKAVWRNLTGDSREGLYLDTFQEAPIVAWRECGRRTLWSRVLG